MSKRIGIDPSVWGPSGWHILHRLSFVFSDIEEARTFYATMPHILPCPMCRQNFSKHWQNVPFPTHISDVPKWVSKIHTLVNTHIGRKIQHAVITEDTFKKDISGEWTFVSSVAEMHPGQKYIRTQPSFFNSLETFLSIWAKYTKNVPSPPLEVIHSKIKLKAWISSLSKNKKNVRMHTCNNNTGVCSLSLTP